MVHPLSGIVQNDEKEVKRLNSLEQKIIEVENNLLRTSKAALEKRIAELEAALKESTEERDKLKQTIAHMNNAKKDVTPSEKDCSIEGLIDDNDTNSNDTDESSDDSISIVDKEEEIIYGRILNLIENMKSDCQKAINMKIPTESQLPKAPGSKLSSSKSPSPTDGLISPSKMIGRPFTPSLIPSSIPTSRVGTPNGAISPPNTQIPTKNTSLPSPSKTSHLPSRSSTPQSPPNSNVPVTSLNNKKHQRPRTGSWPANCSNIPSRPNSPQPAGHHNISTGIPSNLQKLQYRRQITC